MKKSIFYSLMSLAALLFCSTAFAQHNVAKWPAKNTFDAITPTAPVTYDGFKVARVDSIYFCSDKDSIHPIELGYDVAHLRLSPLWGKWSLYAATEQSGDYSATVTVKNGGAGNAFNILPTGGSDGTGAYIFRYETTSTQCGLDLTENVLVYVFVLPKLKSEVTKNVSVCKNEVVSGNILFQFPYTDLFNKANLTVSVLTPASWTVPTTKVGDSTYFAQATVTGPKKYTCGGSFKFSMNVKVTDNRLLSKIPAVMVCDTAAIANDSVKNYLRIGESGKYAPAIVGGAWIAGPGVGEFHKTYIFTYADCKGNDLTVEDSLVYNRKWVNGRSDTTFVCSTIFNGGPIDLADFYSKTPNPKPTVLYNNLVEWKDYGISKNLPVVFGANGTVFSTPSEALPSKMVANESYHFLYTFASPDCKAGDSGYFVLIVKDPFKAVDYRAQMCKTHISGTNAKKFDLFAFTGVQGAKWAYSGPAGITTAVSTIEGDSISKAQLAVMNIGTHKLTYTVGASGSSICAGSGTGVMYLKIAGNAVIPSSVTQKFCVLTKPGSFNLDEILGYTDPTRTWELTSVNGGNVAFPLGSLALTQAELRNATFDLTAAGQYLAISAITDPIAANQKNTELTFTMTGGTCKAGAVTVKVILTNTIL